MTQEALLLSGVDTVRWGFGGFALPASLERRARTLTQAEGGGKGETFEAAGATWTVTGHGRGMSILAAQSKAEGITLTVSNPNAPNNPPVMVEVHARPLAGLGWRECYARAREIATDLLGRPPTATITSRLDLMCDVAHPSWAAGGVMPFPAEEMVGDWNQGKNGGITKWHAGGSRFETRYFGAAERKKGKKTRSRRSPLMRAYHKWQEVRQVSRDKAPWLFPKWRAAAKALGIEVDLASVWRLEFELPRAWLKEQVVFARSTGEAFSVDGGPDAFGESLPFLWRRLTDNTPGKGRAQRPWISWREPKGPRKARWPVRESWRLIQGASFADVGPIPGDYTLMRVQESAANLRALHLQLAGVLATYAGLSGAETWDEVLRDVTERQRALEHMAITPHWTPKLP